MGTRILEFICGKTHRSRRHRIHIMDKKLLEYTSTGYRSPGPAAYIVKPTIGKEATDPSIKKNPAYSIQGRRTKELQSVGPGPAFNTTQLTRYGTDRTPGGLLSKRFVTRELEQTPGPADYCVSVKRVLGGLRMLPDKGKRRSEAPEYPGPNAYSLPGTRDTRGPRMAGERFRTAIVAEFLTPGPGQYMLPHGDLYLSGNYRVGRSLGKRFQKSEPPLTPGPADYDGRVRATCHAAMCRKTTFGMRRPNAVATFAVPEDNQDDCYR